MTTAPRRDPQETLRNLILDHMEEHEIASIRQVAMKLGLSKDTVRTMLDGGSRHDEHTLLRVAGGLRLPIQRVRAAARVTIGVRQPRVMPPEWNRLPQRQWVALCAVADALLDALDQSGDPSPLRHDTNVHNTTGRDAPGVGASRTPPNGPPNAPIFSHAP